MMNSVNIIGAGLAGSEAALYLAKSGIEINLYDMKPNTRSPAHSLDTFCELVCNNSLCNAESHTPHNLLYCELGLLGSEVVKLIEQTRIQDSVSVAVDKRYLSQLVTEAIRSNDRIHVFEQEVVEIPDDRPTIMATGPITGSRLLSAIKKRFPNMTQVEDANSIVLSFDSIDKSKMEIISDDVFYIHLNKEEYRSLEKALRNAKISIPHNPVDNFDIMHCQTVEVLAKNPGLLAELKLEPMRHDAAATIVLRKDDKLSNSVVISEFTTRMIKTAQEAIIHSIHGLESAQFVRYGQHHYNTFVDAPRILNNHYEVIGDNGLYIVGQLAGIDGYLSAISSANVAARSIVAKLKGVEPVPLKSITMTGALSKYVSTPSSLAYKPTIPLFELISTKKEPNKKYEEAIQAMKRFVGESPKIIGKGLPHLWTNVKLRISAKSIAIASSVYKA